MPFDERKVQKYIWNHSEDLFAMIEKPNFEVDPNKKTWEYAPWELLYFKLLKDYEELYKSLERAELFGCEVGLEKDGENTIRADFLGDLEGDNGLIICELKMNRQAERQAYTELFAYANHVRGKFAPMGRRDIFYLLISPMEERIVREATINNLLYDKNRILALVPKIEDSLDTLKFELWIPDKEEFRNFASSSFAAENIDVFKICWKGAMGKWSPIERGKAPTADMIHQLNKVAHYASQIMEANGINGFVFCSQSYPEVRDEGYLENGLTLCGINPFESAKTRFLVQQGCPLEEAVRVGMDALKTEDIFPALKGKCDKALWGWRSIGWPSCLDEIGFEVVKRVNQPVGPSYYERDKGCLTWESYLHRSAEDKLCWNYDIILTGLFRELYDIKLERHYNAFKDYTQEEKGGLIEDGVLEYHCIDMIYSQRHVRDFIDGLIGYNE